MDLILIKILFAHLIGDFFLQPTSWVKDKEAKKLRSGKLYLHVCIHIVLIFALFFSFNVWLLALLIGAAHFLIDLLKLYIQTKKNARWLFFIDQLAHVLAIVIIWNAFYQRHIDFDFLNNKNLWLIIFGGLFLTMPSSIMIRVIINKWIPNTQTDNQQSLQNAGKYIGVLERLIIFLFVLTNHFEAVGFLLAAKSIFRFGDLTNAHDLKLTEYVLIGTLLSFGVAIAFAMGTRALLN